MKKIAIYKSFLLIFIALIGIFILTACGENEKPHEHDYNYSTEIVDPVGVNNGYTLHTCKCGESVKDNFTCLLTFESISTSDESGLPVIGNQIVNVNSQFAGVENTDDFEVVAYRIYKTESFYTNIYGSEIITSNLNIKVVWDKVEEPIASETAFEELIGKIEKLENISKQYNIDKNSTNDAQVRVLQYLRQARYSGFTWNLVGGTMENDFTQYVLDNQGEDDLSSLQTLEYFTIPKTNKQVDFVHMMAIMNVAIKSGASNTVYNDLVGWGGDLCQLAVELKGKNLTGSAIQESAYNLFNNTSSSFSCYDLTADLDAINVVSLYERLNSNKSISYAMKEYYKGLTTNQRKTDFLSIQFADYFDNTTGKITKTQAETASIILDRLSGNGLITYWCSQNGVNFTNDAEEFTACAMAFAKYFID